MEGKTFLLPEDRPSILFLPTVYSTLCACPFSSSTQLPGLLQLGFCPVVFFRICQVAVAYFQLRSSFTVSLADFSSSAWPGRQPLPDLTTPAQWLFLGSLSLEPLSVHKAC